jgi:hypothetical protein
LEVATSLQISKFGQVFAASGSRLRDKNTYKHLVVWLIPLTPGPSRRPSGFAHTNDHAPHAQQTPIIIKSTGLDFVFK